MMHLEMDNITWSERLFAITQACLAIVIVLGGGIMIALNLVATDVVVGLMGAVVGFYFGRDIGQRSGQAQVFSAIERRFKIGLEG